MLVCRRNMLVGIGAAVVALPSGVQAAALAMTPTEDIGPFYPVSRPADQDLDMTRIAGRHGCALGTVIEVTGKVRNDDGSPAAGALLDIWQANAAGRYTAPVDHSAAPLDPDFQGSAKVRTGADGSFRILTVKPGAYPAFADMWRTPHIHFDVTGQRSRLITQMYFPGEPRNETDFLRSRMATLGDDPARLTARALEVRADGVARFEWNIVILKA
jgi:protocatechuate 3,4-dioxygenase beta subunit